MLTTKEALDSLFNIDWSTLNPQLKDKLYYLRSRYFKNALSQKKQDEILGLAGYKLVSDKKWQKEK